MKLFLYGFVLGALAGPFLYEALKYGYLRLKLKLKSK